MMDIERFRFYCKPEEVRYGLWSGPSLIAFDAEIRGAWSGTHGPEVHPIKHIVFLKDDRERLESLLNQALKLSSGVWVEGEMVPDYSQRVSGRNRLKLVWAGTDADLAAYEQVTNLLK